MDENKKTNIIKLIIGLLVVMLGLGVFFAYRGGLFSNNIPWILIAIIGGVVVLIISGILVLPATRINKTSRTFEYRTDQHNSDYSTFTPSKKKSNEIRYCEYCGYVVKQEETICINCGQKIQ